MNTFQIGTVYTTGESRDYIWRFVVVSRTAKFITIKDILSGDTKRVGVKTDSWNNSNVERAYPLGTYSMAPSIHADQVYA